MRPDSKLDSYLWRGVHPLGEELQRVLLASPLLCSTVRPVVQIYLRSHDYFYPCYLPSADGNDVLKHLSPLLNGAADIYKTYVESVFGKEKPQFWLWGEQDQEVLRRTEPRSLPEDLLVAAFCRLNVTQLNKLVEEAGPPTGTGFSAVADHIQKVTKELRANQNDDAEKTLDVARLIEFASTAMYGHAGETATIFAIRGALERFMDSKDIKILQSDLEKHVTGAVCYIAIPLEIGGWRLGLLGTMLWADAAPDDEATKKSVAQVVDHLNRVRAQLQALYLGLKPLWIVHCQTHGAQQLELDKILKLSTTDPVIPIISKAANALGGHISLTHDLRLIQELVLLGRPTKTSVMKYAIAEVAYKYRSRLMDGEILAIRTGRSGSDIPSLMIVAGFSREDRNYTKKMDGRPLSVDEKGMAEDFKSAWEGLKDQRSRLMNIGICHQDHSDPGAGSATRGALVIWARSAHPHIQCQGCKDNRCNNDALVSAIGGKLQYAGGKGISEYRIFTIA